MVGINDSNRGRHEGALFLSTQPAKMSNICLTLAEPLIIYDERKLLNGNPISLAEAEIMDFDGLISKGHNMYVPHDADEVTLHRRTVERLPGQFSRYTPKK